MVFNSVLFNANCKGKWPVQLPPEIVLKVDLQICEEHKFAINTELELLESETHMSVDAKPPPSL